MDAMITYWSDTTGNKIYFNVPITTSIKGDTYKIQPTEWDEDYLHTALTPEGLYAMLDLSTIVNTGKAAIAINAATKVGEERRIKELGDLLTSVRYDGKTLIMPVATDTMESLTLKLDIAQKVLNILRDPSNTNPADGYSAEKLV